MSKVIAIIDSIGNLNNMLSQLNNVDNYTEIIVFLNGTNMSYDIPESYTVMESEVTIDLDRVYRQILSYVTQLYSEGQLFIFKAGDTLPEFDVLDKWKSEGIYINSDSIPTNLSGGMPLKKVKDLFNLTYGPFGFSLVLDISCLHMFLTSRNLYEFVDKFINLPYFITSNKSNIAEMVYLSSKYGKDLINLDEIELPYRNIIKLLMQ
jgi:hypothetical protein